MPAAHTTRSRSSIASQLRALELLQLRRLATPAAIQAFLNSLPYSSDSFYRSPLTVLRDRVAHCFDGAVFAAMCLREIGFPPLILELLPNRRDDDHILALFGQSGRWGAIAKSNFVGLRFREPIFRTLRELSLSYFEDYFNAAGEKTLRGHTASLNLSTLDGHAWTTCDDTMSLIAGRLDRLKRYRLLTPAMARRLAPVDPLMVQAGLLGSNPEGLFKVPT